jgi:hypothetical protein
MALTAAWKKVAVILENSFKDEGRQRSPYIVHKQNETTMRVERFISKEGLARFEDIGAGFEEALYFMNLVAKTTAQAWKTSTGHTAPSLPFQFEPHEDTVQPQNYFSIFHDRQARQALCKIHKASCVFLSGQDIIEVARHESEHVFQNVILEETSGERLAGLDKKPLYLPWLLRARRAFACQVPAALGDNRLTELSNRAYRAAPYECMAFMAGYYAELRFCERFGGKPNQCKGALMRSNRPFMAMLTPKEQKLLTP